MSIVNKKGGNKMNRLYSEGDALINPQGKELRIIKWMPDKKLFTVGKWTLKDEQGNIIKMFTAELRKEGFTQKDLASAKRNLSR